jgi:phosphomevalonate kinase
MRARAPGKVVLSGAYAVLEGARAIVAAVDRYVVADGSRSAAFVTPEVDAALAPGEIAPFFDASALREGERKLGLGSSAAIVVASLGVRLLAAQPALGAAALAAQVFPVALRAHRQAQGGGSGIDVAASAFGGIQIAQPIGETLVLTQVSLPAGVQVRVLAARAPASTPELIRRVHSLRAQDAALYRRLMARQAEASESTAAAVLSGNAAAFVCGLAEQAEALSALGVASGADIVTEDMARLQSLARSVGAAALPAGAGGGDIALWVSQNGVEPPQNDALRPIALTLGAPGLERVSGAPGASQ